MSKYRKTISMSGASKGAVNEMVQTVKRDSTSMEIPVKTSGMNNSGKDRVVNHNTHY